MWRAFAFGALSSGRLRHVVHDWLRRRGESETVRQPCETTYPSETRAGGDEDEGPAELSSRVAKVYERAQPGGVDEGETGRIDGEARAPLHEDVINLPTHLLRRDCVQLTCDDQMRLVGLKDDGC